MAIAEVQSQFTGTTGAAGTSSLAATLALGTTAGNLVIAAIYLETNSAITLPGGWSLAVSLAPAASRQIAIAYLPNCGAGLTSFTFSWTGNKDCAIVLSEWSGLATSSPLDVTASGNNTTNSTAVTSGTTAATAQASELAYVAFGTNNTSLDTVSSFSAGYTNDVNNISAGASPFAEIFTYEQVLSATGAQSFSATMGRTALWQCVIATFLPAVVSGSATMASNSVLAETQAQVVTPANLEADSVLSQTQALVLANGQTLASNATLSETAQLATAATLVGSAALNQAAARLVANGGVLAGNAAFALAGAQLVATAAMLASDSLLSATGASIGQNVPGLALLLDVLVGVATLADAPVGVVLLADSAVGVVALADSPAEPS